MPSVSVEVRDPRDCRYLIDPALTVMGGIDLVVCVLGPGSTSHAQDARADDGGRDAGLAGAVELVDAALDELHSDAIVALVSAQAGDHVHHRSARPRWPQAGSEDRRPDVRFTWFTIPGPATAEGCLAGQLFEEWTGSGDTYPALDLTARAADVIMSMLDILASNPSISFRHGGLAPLGREGARVRCAPTVSATPSVPAVRSSW